LIPICKSLLQNIPEDYIECDRKYKCFRDTFIFKKYLILPWNSTKLPSFLQDRVIGRSPRA